MKAFVWIFAVAGIWLIVAPFVLKYSGVVQWNDILVGLLIFILSLISLGSGNNSSVSG